MRKLTGPINGNLITRSFLPDFIGEEDLINCGDCMHWAYVAEKLYNNVKLWSNYSHAFVKQGGLFYDSTSPNGISHWQKLLTNESCGIVWSEEYSWAAFQKEWNCDADWDAMDALIKKFWRQHAHLTDNEIVLKFKNLRKVSIGIALAIAV